jgi:hypothetical protein
MKHKFKAWDPRKQRMYQAMQWFVLNAAEEIC